MYTYLWCFFIFGFIGWCGEVIYAAMVERRFVNRGFLNGPFCPIYGFGVVLIDFCLRPTGRSLAAVLIGSMLLGSGLEWLAGFLLEKVFHQKWWDYSKEPHNLNGYICLKFSLLWALAGAAVEWAALPAVRSAVALVPHTAGKGILAVLLVLVLTDFGITAVGIFGMNRRLKNLEYVSEKIKAGSDLLGEGLYAGTVAVGGKAQELSGKAMELGGKAQELGEDWKREALRLKEKYETSLRENRVYHRLMSAFPDLRSLQHNEQLEALRQNVSGIRRRSTDLLRRRDEAAAAIYEGRLEPGRERPFAYGMGYTKLFWVFLIGSVIGFVCETLYALVAPPHVLELRTSLVFGPFILIYGVGAVAFTLVLRHMYNQRDLLIFFATMVIGGAVEYLCSFLQQAWFGTVSWEYSDSPLNIGGRTNLMYSVFWGILGVLWVKDMYPALSRMLGKIPKKAGRVLTVVLSVLLAADILISAGAVYRWGRRENGLPAANAAEKALDRAFPDSLLEIIYPHMEYVGKPDIVREPPLPENQD